MTSNKVILTKQKEENIVINSNHNSKKKKPSDLQQPLTELPFQLH